MKYLFDTNACSTVLRDTNSSVALKLRSADQGDVVLCSIVRGELIYGAHKSVNPVKKLWVVQSFLGQFASLAFDDSAADVYGRIRHVLASQGKIIGPNDLMIAAIALANNLTLVTHNTAEFGRVPELKIEDWQA